jgi:hypothetical protein
MAKLRFAPEESLMKVLNTANGDPTKFLEDRVYLKNHLEGIYKKFNSVYNRDRSTKFNNTFPTRLNTFINSF